MKVILWGILAAAFLIRIYDLNYNTTFLDEAQYIVIGLKILSGDIQSGIGATSWVGGSTFFYPVITAIFYSIGGILGSRFFSVLLGTASVFLMYQLTKQLLFFRSKRANEVAGLIAASFMAVTTIAVHSSRFAIYDGLAFPLFLLGAVLLHKAMYSGEKRFYLIAVGVLFLSFLAKYITLAFFPLLLLLPLYLAYKTKNRECLLGVMKYFCLPLVALTGAYIGLNFTSLREFIVDQGVVQDASGGEVARLFWEYTGLSYILFLLAAPFFWRSHKFLLIFLLLFSLIPYVIHSATGNTDSIQQHTLLSIIFILPVVGAGFTLFIKKRKKFGIGLLVFALMTQIFISIPQVKAAESFWPDLTESAAAIRKELKPSDRILAESDDSMYLELRDILPQEQVNGPFVFDYNGEEGAIAYKEAIEDKYFQYVQLEGTYFSNEELQVIEGAFDTRYKKIFEKGSLKVFQVQ